MTVFTEIRNMIADNLDDAAGLIGHFGLSTGKPFDTAYGVNLNNIGDGTPMCLSPIGAIVMAQHGDSVGIGWRIPKAWNNGECWRSYPGLIVFAQYLAMTDDVYEGVKNPVDIITAWTREGGRTEKQAVDALHVAAHGVRVADRDSKLLAVISS